MMQHPLMQPLSVQAAFVLRGWARRPNSGEFWHQGQYDKHVQPSGGWMAPEAALWAQASDDSEDKQCARVH